MPKNTLPVQEIEQSTPPTCPHCDHPPFKNSWALKSHIRFKHSGEEGLEAQPVVVAQPESKLTSEKDQLLAEIERLKLQALGKTLPQPKTYTQEEYDAKQPEKLVPPPRRKAWDNRPPWVVPGAQPGRIIPVNQLNADKKTQDSVMKTLMGAKKIPEKYIEYADTPPTKVEFKRGSWADVYKEDLLVRMIPFIWQQDKETKQNWAIMLEQDFYGKPRSFWQFSYPLLIIGFDKSRNYVDYSIAALGNFVLPLMLGRQGRRFSRGINLASLLHLCHRRDCMAIGAHGDRGRWIPAGPSIRPIRRQPTAASA